jgi:hypothetical protein
MQLPVSSMLQTLSITNFADDVLCQIVIDFRIVRKVVFVFILCDVLFVESKVMRGVRPWTRMRIGGRVLEFLAWWLTLTNAFLE